MTFHSLRHLILTVTICAFAAGPVGAADNERLLTTPKDRIQYAIGVNIVENLKNQGVDVDLNLVTLGMKDALNGGGLILSQEDFHKATADYHADVRRYQADAAARREEQKKAGENFLLENGRKEGVVTLPGGVQYRIVRAGTGKKPTLEDEVAIHYRITRVDGRQIGATEPGRPRKSRLSDAHPGLQEVLPLMQEGARWEVAIPPASIGRQEALAAVGVLVYDLELVSVTSVATEKAEPSGGKDAAGK